MLTTIHKLSETWFFKGVMIITALSFVSFFGVGGLDEIRKRHDAVISVGDVKISAGDFAAAFSREVERLKKAFGAGFTEKEAIKIGLVPTLIKTKVAEATVAQVAHDLNLSIPDDLVRIKVLNMSEFQNLDGSFNRRAFEYFLSMNRISENEFLQSFKAQMIENQLFDFLLFLFKDQAHPVFGTGDATQFRDLFVQGNTKTVRALREAARTE